MMQFEVVSLLLFGLLTSTISAPREGLPLLNPGGIGGIFEGPHSETIIRGPDGSEITSEQKGGVVIRNDGLEAQPIVVAEPELLHEALDITEQHIVSAGPIISSTESSILNSANHAVASSNVLLASPSTPLLTRENYVVPEIGSIQEYAATPLVDPELSILDAKPIEIVQQDDHIIETEIIDAPNVEPDQSSDLQGPSGRVITKGSASIVSGPASTTITEPRRIVVIPPKINVESPIISVARIHLGEADSTLAPLSYSTTSGSIEYGYSTTATPVVDRSYINGINGRVSSRIDLGANELRQFIPVVEYSSSNGVVNEPGDLNAVRYSTESNILSSNINTISTAISPTHSVFRASSHNLIPRAAGLVSSNASPSVQKIPANSIAIDGKVDLAYPSHKRTYKLPQILGMALAQFYQKSSNENKDTITIDDKMGDLSQNEITSYDTRQQYLSTPDLTQAEYIAPALSGNGVDPSEVNLAQVTLSQVTRLSNGAFQNAYNTGYLDNGFEKKIRS